MTLYKNKYRVESARLPSWDYAANGYYFITICTQNRECWFGSISEGKMKLSSIGGVAQKYWQDIPKHFPFVQLDAFVIMPNHIHGIIIIEKPDENVSNVETQNIASLRDYETNPKINLGLNHKIWRQSFAGLKLGLQNLPGQKTYPLHGNPVSMTTSFATKRTSTEYVNIS